LEPARPERCNRSSAAHYWKKARFLKHIQPANRYDSELCTLPFLVRDALGSQVRDNAVVERVAGTWTPITSEQLLKRIEAVARTLRHRYSPGDRIALIASNSADWIVVNCGILFARCVSVPIYPNQTIGYIRHILRDCDPRVILADTSSGDRLRANDIRTPIVQLEGAGEARSIGPLDDDEAKPSDLAVLAYTSGTTGQPKGVMLSHANLVNDVLDSFSYAFADVMPGEPVLSVLPFSHVYEHMLVYGYLKAATPIYIVRGINQLLTDLRSVRPVMMATVPRILETVLARIVVQARRDDSLKARLVSWALATGAEYARARYLDRKASLGLSMQYAAARFLVLEKIAPALGLDRLRFCACGSAPLHLDTLLTLKSAGINVVEGYGLTECSPLVTVNVPGREHLGTVGMPVPNVNVRIAPDGEVLVHGPNVMLGYYHDAEETARAIGTDGWLRTGDIGTLDAEGYLRITDRKRDIIKTSGGEAVAPLAIECAIVRSPFIRDALVVGEGRPHIVALAVPDWALLRRELSIDARIPTENLARRTDVRAFVAREVAMQTAGLAPSERISHVALAPAELTVEGGELSPTMKIKRYAVEAKYRSLIDAAYSTEG
jgi:long-chain acyl-CoA synthetase